MELAADPEGETAELTSIYEARGLTPDLAGEVARQLMATDALGAHLRDELGMSNSSRARPLQAAVSSFVSFAVGALVPMAAAALGSPSTRGIAVTVATLIGLLALGALGARLGGAPMTRAALRVGLGGALALALTFGVGALVGTAV
ncbi:MAG: VIT1/CCC1 transporter family protein [Microthrixaceae bacterium]